MGTWGDSCWNLTKRLHREVMRYEPKTFHPMNPIKDVHCIQMKSYSEKNAEKLQRHHKSSKVCWNGTFKTSACIHGAWKFAQFTTNLFWNLSLFWPGCVCLSCTQNAVAFKARSDEWKAKQKRFACGMIESLESIKNETSERIVVNNSTAFNRHQLIVFLFIARNNIFCRFQIRSFKLSRRILKH